MGGLTRGTEESVPNVPLATSFAGTNIESRQICFVVMMLLPVLEPMLCQRVLAGGLTWAHLIGLLVKMIPNSSLALIKRTHLHCLDSRDSHSSFSSKLELENLLMYEMLKTRLADPLCTASTVDDRVFGSRT